MPPVKPRKLDPGNHPQAKPCFSEGGFGPPIGPSPNWAQAQFRLGPKFGPGPNLGPAQIGNLGLGPSPQLNKESQCDPNEELILLALLKFGIFGLGSLASDLWLELWVGIFGLGTLLRIFSLGSLARDLWFWIFSLKCLGSLA